MLEELLERRIGGVILQGYSRTEGGLTYNLLQRDRRRFDMNGFPNRNSSDVAIVDPMWNGFGESIRMATLADAYHVNVASHLFSGPLATAMCAHF